MSENHKRSVIVLSIALALSVLTMCGSFGVQMKQEAELEALRATGLTGDDRETIADLEYALEQARSALDERERELRAERARSETTRDELRRSQLSSMDDDREKAEPISEISGEEVPVFDPRKAYPRAGMLAGQAISWEEMQVGDVAVCKSLFTGLRQDPTNLANESPARIAAIQDDSFLANAGVPWLLVAKKRDLAENDWLEIRTVDHSGKSITGFVKAGSFMFSKIHYSGTLDVR